MNLSVIIPNYNGEELLKKNLPKVFEAIKDYKKGKVEIIIPDDPSTDGSREIIAAFIKKIKSENITGGTIENNDKNKSGFSKNVNRGVSIATGDILILLNSDVYPHKNFLLPLLKHFEDPQVFAAGCLEESIEDGKTVLRGRGMGRFKRGFLLHSKGEPNKNNTLWVSGGSGAFRKNIWDRLSGFDPLYDPFYWEDIDLSYRAQKSGYKIVFEPESIVTHEHEKGIVKETYEDSYVKKVAYRNQFIFIWKNITDPELIYSHIIWLPYNLIKAIFSGDFSLLSGFFLAILNFSKITKSRKTANKLFTKKDADIIRPYEHS